MSYRNGISVSRQTNRSNAREPMLDIRYIREHVDEVEERLSAKGVGIDVREISRLDTRRRNLLSDVETLKSRRNAASKNVGSLKKSGRDISQEQQKLRELGERIKTLDSELREVEAMLEKRTHALPNLPHPSVPIGRTEVDNRIVRVHGAPRAFDFEPMPHWVVGERLQVVDFERAARMSGSGFRILMGDGARLQRCLIQFMLDVHVREHGYKEVALPYLVNRAAMTGCGQLPKLADDMYHIGSDDLWLIPTAEVPITNMYREEILDQALPICLTGCTPCFRREAGAAGRETRGMIRLHQFDKVEMVKVVDPSTSYRELESLTADAEDILQRLGLHYRVIELCTGDLSFAAAKCYDIELWAPAQNRWLEVSSCSNFEDFQARRSNIRYRPDGGKPEFVHTLNGSGVALPRLMVAILENNQEADGSITLPEAIRPYMGGLEKICAP